VAAAQEEAAQTGVSVSQAYIDKVKELGAAYGELQQKIAESQLSSTLDFEQSQIGRNPTEQDVAGKLQDIYGSDYISQMNGPLADHIRLVDQLTQAYNTGKQATEDFFSTLKSDLRNGEGLWQSFGDAVGTVLDDIANKALQMAADGIWDSIFGGLTNSGSASSGIGSFLSSIFHFASGTMSAPGGLSLVGENGPELVNLPAGAQVYNAQQTAQMMGGGQQIVQVIDQRNSGSIQQQQSTGPNGEKVLRLLVRDEVTQARRRGAAGFAF
jgi:hypothetical protein